MRTRLSLFCDEVIEAGWLVALVVVPLFFDIYSQRVFEPDKLSLLRSLALVMSAFWLLRLVEDWRAGRHAREGAAAEVRRPAWKQALAMPLVLPTLGLVLVYLVSTALSVDQGVSFLGSYQRLQGTYTTLAIVAIFFMMLEGLRTRGQLNRFVTTAILVSFPIALYGLGQHFGLDPLPWGGNVTTRVASNMGNAIFVGAYLILIVPLTLSRLLENWREAAGELDWRSVLTGLLAYALLGAAMLAAMAGRRSAGLGWLGAVALPVGVVLQVPIYRLTPAGRRNTVLAIALPLTFASLVGLPWIQEIVFPPPPGSESPVLFWYGLGIAVAFLVAMGAFAFYLRKPVARLLLLAAYSVVLIAQLVCIFYTGSRGPLLGLLAGGLVFLVVLGLVKRQVWLPWLAGGLAVCALAGLVVFNTVEAPWLEKLRSVPYVGRLGQVLQTEEGTGKVRVLIWEGVVDLVSPHEPLRAPAEVGGADPFNVLRPLTGYGPESMYVAYNRFYPPELAHYEKRNASPDRSHNETFDALATMGILGLAAYMLVFASVVYYGLRFLRLIGGRRQALTFAGLWAGGGLLGGLASWLVGGAVYLGVGIPFGMVGGLAAYLLVATAAATADRGRQERPEPPQALLLVALLSAIVAHFVEIHFGISIASTRTLFWMYSAILIVLGTRPAWGGAPNGAAAAPVTTAAARRTALAAGQAVVPAAKTRVDAERKELRKRAEGGRERRVERATARRTLPPLPLRDLDWWGAVALGAVLALLVLSTILFNTVTAQEEAGAVRTLWRSLTQLDGEWSPLVLGLLLSTWGTAALVYLGELATQKESAGTRPLQWLAGAGAFLGIALLGALTFGLLHAARLVPLTVPSGDEPNALVGAFLSYTVLLFVVVLLAAAVLVFLFRRAVASARWTGRPRDLALAGALLVVPAAFLLAIPSNLTPIAADILYKQGLTWERAGDTRAAVQFYQQALDLAPDQDFYYLFLGRALMEEGRATSGASREEWLAASEGALQSARRIAPLNTDHSANLARLYRTWGAMSAEPQRKQRLERALAFYADARALSPNHAGLANEVGQTYVLLDQPSNALEAYQESLQLDDAFAQTYQLLGELYLERDKWGEAQDALERAVQLDRKAMEAWSSLGYVYSHQGDLERSREAYETAVALRPNNHTNRKNLALVLQQLGRVADALREAEAALRLAPEAEQPALRSFIAQLQDPALSLSPEDARRLQDLLDAGQAQIGAEDWDGAAESFLSALELSPRDYQAHSGLAYAYARLGRTDEAIAESLAVLEAVPDDYASHKNLAVLYDQKGDLALAVAHAERALSLAPEEDRASLEEFLAQRRPPSTRAGGLAPAERVDMYKAAPPMSIDPNQAYWATIVTERGSIVVLLDAKEAPQTTNNFVFLAEQGFYDGLTFHRVVEQSGFSIIQGGDPTGTGKGGPGYTVPAEIGLPHRAGAIAMARLGDEVNPSRASSGSQFYIARVAIPHLDPGYTVFGYVMQGLDVAAKIVQGDKILQIEIAAK